MNKTRWGIRIILLITFTIWFGGIFNQNSPIRGYKEVNYLFGEPGPIISELQPVSRVGGQEETVSGRSFQKIYEDPVYFDFITPVLYRRARVELVFHNTTKIPLRVGIRGVHDNNYSLYDWTSLSMHDDWTTAIVDVDMNKAGWVGGKYRFVLSAPGLVRGNPEHYIAVSSVHMQLYKDPLTFASIQSIAMRTLLGIFH